jgi:hypothetical protein
MFRRGRAARCAGGDRLPTWILAGLGGLRPPAESSHTGDSPLWRRQPGGAGELTLAAPGTDPIGQEAPGVARSAPWSSGRSRERDRRASRVPGPRAGRCGLRGLAASGARAGLDPDAPRARSAGCCAEAPVPPPAVQERVNRFLDLRTQGAGLRLEAVGVHPPVVLGARLEQAVEGRAFPVTRPVDPGGCRSAGVGARPRSRWAAPTP